MFCDERLIDQQWQ